MLNKKTSDSNLATIAPRSSTFKRAIHVTNDHIVVIQMSQITLQTMQLGCHPINMKLIRYSCFCYGKLNDLTMDLQRRVCAIYLAADLQTLWQGQKPPSAASTRPQATALSLKSPLLCRLKTLQRLTREF